MRKHQIDISLTENGISRIDDVIEWLLIALLAFMPLAFGAVQAWSEEVVIAFAAAITICFFLKLVYEKNVRIVWSWAYMPVAIFILLAVFQLIPLPTGFINIISPNTVTTKQELLSDLPNSDELLKSMTISFYPNDTKHNLRLVLAIAAVFFVVVNVYSRTEQIKRLLGAIAIIGGSIAVLALAQDLFGNGKIYWLVPLEGDEAYSGPFANHSHYGQFMNLSIGATLGLIFIKVHQIFTGKKVTPAVIIQYLGSPEAKTLWLLTIMIILGAATIFVSLTRGGMISMFIAAATTVLILGWRQSLKGQGWIFALLALGALICVLYIGFDAVYDRLATLRELHQVEGGRWQIVKDITTAWIKFPFFGTGLGTHAVVYPMFDRSTTADIAAYAENEYAQAAEETGIIGLAQLLVFGILVWKAYVRNIKTASAPIRSSSYGLGFGLLAIMFHSFSDFGQHMPANGILSAVFCALMLGLVLPRQKGNSGLRTENILQRSKCLRIVGLVFISGICGWMLLNANMARLAQANWNKALTVEQSLLAKNWQGNDEEYVNLISHATKAVDYQPENVGYRYWLNVYRWRSLSRAIDPNTGDIPEPVIEFVDRIIDDFNRARLICPTYGAIYCMVGQLERFVIDDPNGADCIRKGFKLAPCDPTACFVTGLLDIEEQQIDASFEKLSRAVELDSRFFRNVVDVYIHLAERPDLAIAIAGDITNRLSYVANILADMEEHKDIFDETQARVVELLKEKCSGSEASADACASLANIYRKERDNEAAIEYYRRALTLDYSQVQWRYALARLLADTGKIAEAIHEARICLRLRPQFKAAKRLIEQLSVLPESVAEGNTIR